MYIRNQQSKTDQFGGSCTTGGIYAVALNDIINMETFDNGDNGSSHQLNPITATGGYFINLDTLEDPAGPSARRRIDVSANDDYFDLVVGLF
jgi:hypothetical protein